MEWSDTGLVLARGVFREADVWLRILFREQGLHTVFAFGGLRSRRRFVGCLEALNILDCRVRTSRNGRYEDLSEAVLVRGPGELRSSRQLLGLAANCLKLVDSASLPLETSPGVFRLLDETILFLGELAGARIPPGSAGSGAVLSAGPDRARTALLPLYFRLRFMSLLGYAPELASCALCQRRRTSDAFFCVEEGGVVCPSCRRLAGRRSGAVLSAGMLDILQDILQTWPMDWLAQGADGGPEAERQDGAVSCWSVSPQERRNLAFCLDGMLHYHVGLAWEDGRYVRL